MKESITGVNSIIEALTGERQINKIIVQKGRRNGRIEAMLNLARAKRVQVQFVERSRMDQMFKGEHHQGVAAMVGEYEYVSLEDILERAARRGEPPFVVILDGIEDPQNLGSIIRTAECAGAHGVIIPRHHAAEVTSVVVRASAGAVEHMAIARETNLVNTIKFLQEKGMWIIGADMQGENEFYATELPLPAAVVIGGEGRGMRRLVRENCDVLVRIPMRGKISSLNASVAAALLIYEVVRRREG
ncbi:23S rRNA (guanosine(2251)-2'-O)-methyltransferase RlmB [Syntrophomonas erecta]